MRKGFPPPTCHVSHVTCRVSRVTCPMSHVIFFGCFLSSGCFHRIGPLGRFDHRVAMSVDMCVCPLPMRFFFRPLIGQHRSHDYFQGLSLVTAPGVKIGCINTTFLVLEHSILTLGALLTYYLANTSHIITSQASHCIGATIRIGREIRCLPYAGFFSLTYTKY